MMDRYIERLVFDIYNTQKVVIVKNAYGRKNRETLYDYIPHVSLSSVGLSAFNIVFAIMRNRRRPSRIRESAMKELRTMNVDFSEILSARERVTWISEMPEDLSRRRATAEMSE